MEFVAEKSDWQGKAGQRLDELARRLPPQPRLTITVFGSTPLQLFVESSFLSEDIDVFGDKDTTDFLEAFVGLHGWAKGDTDLYIQVCSPLAFKSTIDWAGRAIEVERHGHLFRFVHPWDVLVSKLQRLEEKDFHAFQLVTNKTGHPTEDEFAQFAFQILRGQRPRHRALAIGFHWPTFLECRVWRQPGRLPH